MAKKFLIYLFVVFTFFVSEVKADDTAEYKAFVDNLVSGVYNTLPSKKDPKDIYNYFQEVSEKTFALDTMVAVMAGRYGKEMSPEIRERYVKLAKEYLILTYGSIFYTYYQSYDFNFISVDSKGREDWLTVNISLKPGKANQSNTADQFISSTWKTRKTPSGNILVTDIMVQGISPLQAKRSEFEALIKSKKGDMEEFLKVLQDTVDKMRVSAFR